MARCNAQWASLSEYLCRISGSLFKHSYRGAWVPPVRRWGPSGPEASAHHLLVFPTSRISYLRDTE